MRTPENVAKVRTLVTQAVRAAGVSAEIKCPAAVWDNTRMMIGVVIDVQKRMGEQMCVASASFALAPHEYGRDAAIAEKAAVALAAIRHSVQCRVRPAKAKQEAA